MSEYKGRTKVFPFLLKIIKELLGYVVEIYYLYYVIND